MSSNFEFNAPQFVNFTNMDDSKADRFFDINPQKTINHLDSENQDPSSTVKIQDPPSGKKNLTVLRKVLNEIVNHQIQSDKIPTPESSDQGKDLIQRFGKLQLSDSKQRKSRLPIKASEVFSGVKGRGSEKKCHQMITRLDTMNVKVKNECSTWPTNSLQSEEMNEQEVHSTTNKNGRSMKRKSRSPLNPVKKFISLSEQIERFYKDTPERHRSKPSKLPRSLCKTVTLKQNCIPRTPNLITKFRKREVNFPDEKQREEMELEEIKKHQIKALPLNKKILLGPSLSLKAPVIKKPTTIPQPFSLTEVKAKEPPHQPVFHFKAQPVPINILQGPVGIPPRKDIPLTVPITPQIRVPLRFLHEEIKFEEKSKSSDSLTLPRNTKVEPFSFDGRMKETLQHKEDFVKKVIEEEKKSFNSFRAQPMPSFKNRMEGTLKIDRIHKTVPQPFNLTHPKEKKSFIEDQNADRVPPFKARPAAVVHQKPFTPKLQKTKILPANFHLNTEKRAMERQKFDEKIKQKEEEIALILKLQKEEEEKLDKEKMWEDRKKTEFKATAMPRYKVFEIHGSDPEKLTRPQSPLFSSKVGALKKGHI